MYEPLDTNKRHSLLYVVNVDWYFLLHWVDRAVAVRESGLDVHIATNVTSVENARKLGAFGFKVHHVPFSRSSMNPFRDIRSIFSLWQTFRNIRPEIAHCVTIKPVIYGGLICRLLEIPFAASIVGLGTVFARESATSRAVWAVLPHMIALTMSRGRSIVMFENRHDRDVLVKHGGIDFGKTVVLPGAGVDLERFVYMPEIERGTFKILFASRLLKSKGLEVLVKATERLNEAGIRAELHVAGITDLDSNDRIPLGTINEWRSQGKLIWHGNVPDIERLIASSNVVCLPTTYGEGIPRILIEAAACGRTAISTDIPGCREFVNDGVDGLLIPPNHEGALVAALKQLAADPHKRERMGLAGRAKVVKHYSNAVVVGCTLRHYVDLLGDNR